MCVRPLWNACRRLCQTSYHRPSCPITSRWKFGTCRVEETDTTLWGLHELVVGCRFADPQVLSLIPRRVYIFWSWFELVVSTALVIVWLALSYCYYEESASLYVAPHTYPGHTKAQGDWPNNVSVCSVKTIIHTLFCAARGNGLPSIAKRPDQGWLNGWLSLWPSSKWSRTVRTVADGRVVVG